MGALLKEIQLRKDYLGGDEIETIYFGGGTPSLLAIPDIQAVLETIHKTFSLDHRAEITLEANPDDIDEQKIEGWKQTGINRLSIGIQSFFDEDLQWMNRAHNSKQATDSLQLAIRYFENITVDLIYGHPLLTNEKWKQNVEKLISLHVPHISCYALTVEPRTPLQKLINEGKKQDVQEEKQAEQFLLLMKWLEEAAFEQYEISNFAKPGFRSRHNSSYWQGKKYLGLGPSAHSFDGESRQWNISNNKTYIDSVDQNLTPAEKEVLSPAQKINEYIMTSLRTIEGLDLRRVESSELRVLSQKFIKEGKVFEENDFLKLTREGKLFADGIASELLII